MEEDRGRKAGATQIGDRIEGAELLVGASGREAGWTWSCRATASHGGIKRDAGGHVGRNAALPPTFKLGQIRAPGGNQCEATACRVAEHDDAVGIDSEALGVGPGPSDGCFDVLDGTGHVLVALAVLAGDAGVAQRHHGPARRAESLVPRRNHHRAAR